MHRFTGKWRRGMQEWNNTSQPFISHNTLFLSQHEIYQYAACGTQKEGQNEIAELLLR